MLKRFAIYLLLTAVLSSNFSRFYVYAGFKLNQKYVAGKLCVNKLRPWLHCNGKCYFIKKLQEAEQNEKQRDKENLEKSEINFFAAPVASYFAQLAHAPVKKASIRVYVVHYDSRCTADIFKPPRQNS